MKPTKKHAKITDGHNDNMAAGKTAKGDNHDIFGGKTAGGNRNDDASSVYLSQDAKTSIKDGDKSKHGQSDRHGAANNSDGGKKTNTVIQ